MTYYCGDNKLEGLKTVTDEHRWALSLLDGLLRARSQRKVFLGERGIGMSRSSIFMNGMSEQVYANKRGNTRNKHHWPDSTIDLSTGLAGTTKQTQPREESSPILPSIFFGRDGRSLKGWTSKNELSLVLLPWFWKFLTSLDSLNEFIKITWSRGLSDPSLRPPSFFFFDCGSYGTWLSSSNLISWWSR